MQYTIEDVDQKFNNIIADMETSKTKAYEINSTISSYSQQYLEKLIQSIESTLIKTIELKQEWNAIKSLLLTQEKTMELYPHLQENFKLIIQKCITKHMLLLEDIDSTKHKVQTPTNKTAKPKM